MKGTCMSADTATGTPQRWRSSSWTNERKPQLEVIPSTPSATSSSAAKAKGSIISSADKVVTLVGLNPRTTLASTGKGQVSMLPKSPGMRGKTVSTMTMPMRAPWIVLPP